MKSLPWDRAELIREIRSKVWRYLTPAADLESELLEAAALLQMPASELRAIGQLQFLVSDELGQLLSELPFLMRRLATSTANEEEWSSERIRGSIQWGRTLGLRGATGLRNLYVTAPARRAFQTPENEMLVFLLDATVMLGRRSGWHRSTSETVGKLVSSRVAVAERALQVRMLTEIERRPLNGTPLMRVRSGRHKNRYRSVLAAYDLYRSLLGRLDRQAIRQSVEHGGLVSRDDPVLFELLSTFRTLEALSHLGWTMSRMGLFAGSLRVTGILEDERLELTYQVTPADLSRGSIYRSAQYRHGVAVGALRPDLVLRHIRENEERWLLVEVKGGTRSCSESARAAAYDLLAYRTAFAPVLAKQDSPYGLGIAWGAQLAPNPQSEIVLCSPDTIEQALKQLLA
jgi:hypothetical protein